MGFDKVVDTRIWGVTAQNSDLRFVTGDSAVSGVAGGTPTNIVNPLKGSLMWDDCMYILQGVSVAGEATGGSYTVTIETDAVVGYTGLPIARTTLGPLSKASPLPTHMFIDQTAGDSACWFQCHVVAKQYRGTFGTPGANTSERVLQGTMLRGTSAGGFADDRGMTEDETFTLGTTGSNLGMNRLRLWDHAMFWAVAGVSIAGTHDVDIIGSVGGATVSIASTGTGGALNVAGEKLALANSFYGQCVNPSTIIWTETTAGGVSDARVVMLAKSGRGGLAKR
jgi:hypothetical protein